MHRKHLGIGQHLNETLKSEMSGPDYRVTYKTREVDDDRPRRRIPTALDPYLYPEDRDELKRNVALARVHAPRYVNEGREPQDFETSVRRETIRDDVSRTTARGPAPPGATKTTYSVTSAGLEKESEVSLRPTKSREPALAAGPSPSAARRSEYREVDDIEIDRQRTTTMPVRTVRASTKPYDDQDYSRYERVYEVERPRKENGVYIVDARDADVYYGGARESDRGFAGYRNDVYDEDYRSGPSRAGPTRESDYRKSEVIYSSRDDYRSSAPSVQSGAPYMSGARSERAPTAARSQTRLDDPLRAANKRYEDDRAAITIAKGPSRQSTRREEEDFAFVERRDVRAPLVRESFKDPFEGSAAPMPETPRGRTRASMYSMSPSEDEYVMVSPPQQRPGTAATARASSAGEALRSAMFRGDKYSQEERQQRRRSRSISFRAHEADDHYAGDRYHEPPGQEAAECGRYLQSYGGKRGGGEVAYTSRSSRRDDRDYDYKSRGGQMEEYDYERREKEVKYPPKKMRSRSRKRRESDDESYVSKNYEKTIKTTYY